MTDLASVLDKSGRLPAGRLCLEFANTADWHAAAQPEEHLTCYADLAAWAGQVGLFSPAQVAELQDDAKARPELARAILTWALELREALYRIFAAIAHGAAPTAGDLALLNEALPQAVASPSIIATKAGFEWHYPDDRGLDRMLWPVMRSAAALLTSPDLGRVGQCADSHGCGYLFFDTSRNRSRRWCDMDSCGNRAKARRHYARYRVTG